MAHSHFTLSQTRACRHMHGVEQLVLKLCQRNDTHNARDSNWEENKQEIAKRWAKSGTVGAGGSAMTQLILSPLWFVGYVFGTFGGGERADPGTETRSQFDNKFLSCDNTISPKPHFPMTRVPLGRREQGKGQQFESAGTIAESSVGRSVSSLLLNGRGGGLV